MLNRMISIVCVLHEPITVQDMYVIFMSKDDSLQNFGHLPCNIYLWCTTCIGSSLFMDGDLVLHDGRDLSSSTRAVMAVFWPGRPYTNLCSRSSGQTSHLRPNIRTFFTLICHLSDMVPDYLDIKRYEKKFKKHRSKQTLFKTFLLKLLLPD